jgi:hypothetical protein
MASSMLVTQVPYVPMQATRSYPPRHTAAAMSVIATYMCGDLLFSQLSAMRTPVLIDVLKASLRTFPMDGLMNWTMIALANRVARAPRDLASLLTEEPTLIRPMRALVSPTLWEECFPPALALFAPPRSPAGVCRKPYIWSLVKELRDPWTGDASLSMPLRRRVHVLDQLLQEHADFAELVLGSMCPSLLADLLVTARLARPYRAKVVRAITQTLCEMNALDAIREDDRETCAMLGLCALSKKRRFCV